MKDQIDLMLQKARQLAAQEELLQACQWFDQGLYHIMERELWAAYAQQELADERTELYNNLIVEAMNLFSQEDIAAAFPRLEQAGLYAIHSLGYEEETTLNILLVLRFCAEKLTVDFPLKTEVDKECLGYIGKCESLLEAGEIQQMLGVADMTRKISLLNLGAATEIYGDSLYYCAIGQMEAGNHEKAELQLGEALQAYHKSIGEIHKKVCLTLMKLGHLSLHHLKNAHQTEVALTAALGTALKLEDLHLAAEAQSMLGGYLFGSGRYGAALPLLEGVATYLEEHGALEMPEYETFRNMLLQCKEKAAAEAAPTVPDTWQEVYEQFLNCLQQADFTTAESLLPQLIELAQTEGESSLAFAATLMAQGSLYARLARLPEAIAALEQGAKICEAQGYEMEEVYGIGLSTLAQVYADQANFDQAGAYGIKAITALRRCFEAESLPVAKARQNYGVMLLQMGKYPEAIAELEGARQIFQGLGEAGIADYLNATHNLGTCLVNTGDFSRGEALLNEVYREINSREVPLGPHPGLVLQALGHAQLMLGRVAEAERHYAESVRLMAISPGEDHPYYAHALVGYGKTLSKGGKHHLAETHYRKGQEIFERLLGPEHPHSLQTRLNLALLFQELQQYKRALRLYEAIKAPLQTALGEEHPEYATLLINLGTSYFLNGQLAAAEEPLRQAEKLLRQTVGESHHHYRQVLNILGMKQVREGDPEAGLQSFERALAIWEKDPVKSDQYFILLNNLGTLNLSQGKLEIAQQLTERAHQGLETLLSWEHPNVLTLRINLARVLAVSEHHTEAQDTYRRVFQNLELHRRRFFPSLSEQDQWRWIRRLQLLLENFFSYVRKYREIYPELMVWAFNQQLQSRHQQFNLLRQIRQRQAKGQTPEQQQAQEKLEAVRKAVAQWMARPANQRNQSWETMENQLREAEVAYFQLFPEAFVPEEEPLTLDSLAPHFSQDEALVEIFTIKNAGEPFCCVAMVWLPGDPEPLRWVELGSTDTLAQEIWPQYQAWLKQTGGQQRDTFEEAAEGEVEKMVQPEVFYQVLWQPIAEALEGRQTVYLLPSDMYQEVNLSILPVPGETAYVMDRWDIHLISQARDILNGQEAAPSGKKEAILLGDPDFGQKGQASETDAHRSAFGQLPRLSNVAPLPGTRQEVLNIAEKLRAQGWSVAHYLGADSQEAVLRQADRPTILHVATHGFFLPEEKGAADSLLMGDAQPQENPYWRAGLLLSGTQHALEEREAGGEGIFYAYEAASLNLEGTELVVLSACETGLSASEGYMSQIGLQRAFRLAGAQRMLQSLWKVSDEATQLLMEHFYTYLLQGHTQYDALKAAQQALRKQYPHPFYWGAFVLVGQVERPGKAVEA